MPRKSRRISAFSKIMLVVAVICGALVAGGYYVITSIKPIDIAEPEPTDSCTISSGGGEDEVDIEQAANAATISGVAFSRDLPEQAVVIAYATVWQESKFYNIDYGDRDSLGLFQQRPSQEWGEPQQLLDPVYSTGEFYTHLVKVPGYTDIPVYEAAQAVQRSADGFAYDQHEPRSQAMAAAFTGSQKASVTCWFTPSEDVQADTAAAQQEMARVFGVDPAALPLSQPPATGDMGWAMALWAVTHAKEYGLTSVTYGDQRWTAANGGEGWTTVPDSAPEGQVVLG